MTSFVMAIRAILILGAIMLTCGSAGLLLVRLTSPMLRGVGYLGGAFAAGSLGSALLLGGGNLHPQLSVTIADLSILASFVFLHFAVLDISESEAPLPIFGFILLGAQAVVDTGLLLFEGSGRVRVVVAGMLIAGQAAQTASILFPQARLRVRVPTTFVAVLLSITAALNVVRSFALTLGYFEDPKLFYAVAVGTFASFVAVALGLGFGIFWMSTTALTNGLEQMASTDPLTRTFNRRVFLRWCERERERNEQKGTPFSVLMIDFDHFKQVNDTYGHHTGDEVLVSAVEHMQNAIRGIDVLGRWGGEEFAVLLPGATGDAASLVAERLRANVARMRLPEAPETSRVANPMVRMTVSVGVATYINETDTVHMLLKRADAALYEAKATGRNRVVVGARSVATQQWISEPVAP